MADSKISNLPAATTPLAGTEVLPIVQGGVTSKVTISNITDGRAVNASSVTTTGTITTATQMNARAVEARGSPASFYSTGGAMLYSDAAGTATLRTYANSSGTGGVAVHTMIGTTSVLSAYTSGNVFVNTGNLVIGTAGKGIDFSATANGAGTMTSELLDDYEIGTWTATLKGSVSDPTTPVTATGRYTKVGDTVTLWCGFSNVSTVGASGNVTVIGIPFTSGSFKAQGSVWLGNFTIANKYVVAYLGASSSTVTFEDVAGAGFGANLQQSAGDARYLEFTLTYKV